MFAALTVAALVLLVVTARSARRRAPASTVDASTAGPAAEAAAAEPPPSTWTRVRAVSVTALWALAVYGLYTYLGTILTGSAGFSSGLLRRRWRASARVP